MEIEKPTLPFENLDQAKNFLTNRLDDEVKRVGGAVDPDLEEKFQKLVEKAKAGIFKIEKIPKGMTSGRLWGSFLTQIYASPEFYGDLLLKVTKGLEQELSLAESSEEIITLSEELSYVGVGQVQHDLVSSGKLVVSSVAVRALADEVFSETTESDLGLIKLLDVAREYIKKEKPTKSFVLLSNMVDNRLGFGVEIGEGGELIHVGADMITAACRVYKFDETVDGLSEFKDGVKVLPIIHNFKDYPKHFSDPYTLPADLFLLKSTCGPNWVSVHLEGTKVGDEIKENLISSSK